MTHVLLFFFWQGASEPAQPLTYAVHGGVLTFQPAGGDLHFQPRSALTFQPDGGTFITSGSS